MPWRLVTCSYSYSYTVIILIIVTAIASRPLILTLKLLMHPYVNWATSGARLSKVLGAGGPGFRCSNIRCSRSAKQSLPYMHKIPTEAKGTLSHTGSFSVDVIPILATFVPAWVA